MTVNVISDLRLIERYEPLLNELGRQGITDFKLWPIVEDSKSVISSISKSHKQIIRDAKDKGLERVAILEDDVWFPAPNGWQHFLDGIPLWKYDMYLAGTYGLDRPVQNPIKHINGLHAYICHERFYDTFLSLPENEHIDVAMSGLGLYYVEYPFIALQRPGWSSNTRAFSDKNADLSKEDIYYG